MKNYISKCTCILYTSRELFHQTRKIMKAPLPKDRMRERQNTTLTTLCLHYWRGKRCISVRKQTLTSKSNAEKGTDMSSFKFEVKEGGCRQLLETLVHFQTNTITLPLSRLPTLQLPSADTHREHDNNFWGIFLKDEFSCLLSLYKDHLSKQTVFFH
jgi:hypothetical protein